MRVRFRVDGVLSASTTVPRRMISGVISRIKIMGDLDISEKRVPQDGRVGLVIDGHHVDLRVVTLPLVHGESVVMRILDKDSAIIDLNRLGMADQERKAFERGFSQAHGAVLVTGPTGSGKTSSLYAALHKLNTIEKNTITIEDPVEYQLKGIKQMGINPKAGLTFATGLRSMMRGDPDIIMVGEIRDRETAQIAVEAALTGHLVLSTLHTNDAPTAVSRLIEMGIEPFLVASAVETVVAQRLARTLCPNCRRPERVTAEILRDNGFVNATEDIDAYEPAGCARCGGSGYKGRTGLYEVMTVTREIRSLAVQRASSDDIAELAVSQGMRRMRDDGLDKIRAGITSVAEVARVSGSA
jgi:type IV pilus assembly protein PilB